MAGDAGGDIMQEWLSAVQITQGLSQCLDEGEAPYFIYIFVSLGN